MIILYSDIIHIHGAAKTMQGGRSENQDDLVFLDTPLGFLAIVCDGMGGGPGGKTASYIAKCEIAKAICSCTAQTPCEYALKMAVSLANDAIEAKMTEVPALQGMGSTFVAILINKKSAYVAHAGDSRCYLLRKGKCIYRSQDHSLVAELVKKKALTEEEARLSPQSNVISRGLGSIKNHVPEIEEISFKKGDRIVLCTDGVWGIMPHKDLVKRFTQKIDIQSLVTNISSEIDSIGYSKGGCHDNHTLAIFDIELDSNYKKPIKWKQITIISSVVLIVLAIFFCLILYLTGNHKNHNGFVQVNSSDIIKNKQQRNGDSGIGSTSTHVNSPRAISDSLSAVIDSFVSARNKENDSTKVDKRGEQNDSASHNKMQQEAEAATPLGLIQSIIKEYESVIVAESNTVHDTQLILDSCHASIKTMIVDLTRMCKDSDANDQITNIGYMHKNCKWSTDIPNSDGKYKPTKKTTNFCRDQIKSLEKLKDKF